MTSHDENHIIRTSPARFGKGLVVVLAFMAIVGYVIITQWTFMLSVPPPVAVPKPSPEQTQAATGGGGGDTGTAPAPPAGTLSIPSGAATPGNPPYAPETLTVKKGDAINVVNDDNAPHTATSGTGPEDPNSAQSFDTSLIMAGQSAEIDTSTLDAGDYPYYCTVHPFMKGTITVTA